MGNGCRKGFLHVWVSYVAGGQFLETPDDFSLYLLGKNEPTSPLLNHSLEEGHLSMVTGL